MKGFWFIVTTRLDGRTVAHEVRAQDEAAARRVIQQSCGSRGRKNEIVEEVYRRAS